MKLRQDQAPPHSLIKIGHCIPPQGMGSKKPFHAPRINPGPTAKDSIKRPSHMIFAHVQRSQAFPMQFPVDSFLHPAMAFMIELLFKDCMNVVLICKCVFVASCGFWVQETYSHYPKNPHEFHWEWHLCIQHNVSVSCFIWYWIP